MLSVSEVGLLNRDENSDTTQTEKNSPEPVRTQQTLDFY